MRNVSAREKVGRIRCFRGCEKNLERVSTIREVGVAP